MTVFGGDMSSSAKIDNREKYILILGKGSTKGLEHTLSAEKMYSISFSKHNKKIVYACIIIEQVVICLLIVQKFVNLK